MWRDNCVGKYSSVGRIPATPVGSQNQMTESLKSKEQLYFIPSVKDLSQLSPQKHCPLSRFQSKSTEFKYNHSTPHSIPFPQIVHSTSTTSSNTQFQLQQRTSKHTSLKSPITRPRLTLALNAPLKHHEISRLISAKVLRSKTAVLKHSLDLLDVLLSDTDVGA
jgi:hypothetical protein